jgi:hypothetical protein
VLAADRIERDEALLAQFAEIDVDSAGPEDFGDLVAASEGNASAPASLLHAVVRRFSEDLGVESVEGLIGDLDAEVDALAPGEEGFALKVAAALAKGPELEEVQLAKVLQMAVDFLADESTDSDDKKPIVLALDALRRARSLHIPDPTPIPTTHFQEWTKSQK